MYTWDKFAIINSEHKSILNFWLILSTPISFPSLILSNVAEEELLLEVKMTSPRNHVIRIILNSFFFSRIYLSHFIFED